MTRIPNRTAHIKPSTREAVLDQLAAIADGIIHDRKIALIVAEGLRAIEYDLTCEINHRWWHHFAWWRR